AYKFLRNRMRGRESGACRCSGLSLALLGPIAVPSIAGGGGGPVRRPRGERARSGDRAIDRILAARNSGRAAAKRREQGEAEDCSCLAHAPASCGFGRIPETNL